MKVVERSVETMNEALQFLEAGKIHHAGNNDPHGNPMRPKIGEVSNHIKCHEQFLTVFQVDPFE